MPSVDTDIEMAECPNCNGVGHRQSACGDALYIRCVLCFGKGEVPPPVRAGYCHRVAKQMILEDD